MSLAAFISLAGLAVSLNPNHPDTGKGAFNGHEKVVDHLVAILDKLSSMEHRFSSLDQRIVAMDQRFNLLDQKMALLGQRVTALEQHLMSQMTGHSRAECVEVANVTHNVLTPSTNVTSPSTGAVENTPPDDTPQQTFRLKRVTKQETNDSYLITLDYEAPSKPAIFFGKHEDYLAELPLFPVGKQDENRVELKLAKGPNADRPYITFFLPDEQFTARLKLNNTPDEIEIPHTHFKIVQGTDITFHSGEPVSVNFTSEVEEVDDDEGMDKINMQLYDVNVLMDSQSGDNVVNRYNSHFQRYNQDPVSPLQSDSVKFEGSVVHRNGSVSLSSSLKDVQGVIEIGITLKFSSNCLLAYMYSKKSTKFYRDDHAGPFQKDSIGFIRDDFNVENISHMYCDTRRESCFVYCEAAGDHVSGIGISKVENNSDTKSADVHGFSVTRDYWGKAWLNLPNVTFADAGNYLCTAMSREQVITQTLFLEVVRAPKIDKDLSTVTTFENGSVAASCIAEGSPTPTVYFHLDLEPHEYHVRTSHPGSSLTRTDLFISSQKVAYTLYSFDCIAFNIEAKHEIYSNLADYHSMYAY